MNMTSMVKGKDAENITKAAIEFARCVALEKYIEFRVSSNKISSDSQITMKDSKKMIE